MSILSLIIAFALVGFALYLVTTYVPMPPPMKQILVVAVVIILAIWVLQSLGSLGAGFNRPIQGL